MLKNSEIDSNTQTKNGSSVAQTPPNPTTKAGPATSSAPPTSAKEAAPSRAGEVDFTRLRLTQDFAAGLGVKRLLTAVAVKKPDTTSFFRVRDDGAYQGMFAVLDLKDFNEPHYLVTEEVAMQLADRAIQPRLILTCINRGGGVFMWPVKVPSREGRRDGWSESAYAAAMAAKESWVRMCANSAASSYDVMTATGIEDEPVWPPETFEQLLNIAFKGAIITNLDHPAIRRLQGAI